MRKLILLCWLAIWLAACSTESPIPPTLRPTLLGELRQFASPTASLTPSPMPVAPTIALTPLPTATPYTHTIAKDDTLLGVALRYGITLEELKAANPGVDPGFLVIGNRLVIPISGGESNEIPLPTPLAIQWQVPRCYPSAEGGLWCFMMVRNDQLTAVENLSGWISLVDQQGNPQAGQAAGTPLNLLPVGVEMPLMAYFSPPVDAWLLPQGQLLSAVAVEDGTARYLDAEVQVSDISIAEDGMLASAQGKVMIPEASIPSTVWLALVAYDADGEVVGIRKFDLGAPCGVPSTAIASSTPQPTPSTGTPTFTPTSSSTPAPLIECTTFEFTVYSLGPAIQRVDVLLEARH